MTLLSHYALFLLKTLTLVAAILFTFAGILTLSKNKDKFSSRIKIKHINKRYDELAERLQHEILPKSQLKIEEKKRKKLAEELKKKERKRIYYIEFIGDMHASEAQTLREKITAILAIAMPKDEVVVAVESAGGVVHGYGLCASQLTRLRQKNIHLTIIVDKVAASGGYMMASVANQIIAAPFAIIGSIGVVAQIPNFHRLLKEHNIDFEQITAGEYKRTLSYFGENTTKARQKVQEEIDEAHQLFKKFILEYRSQLDIDKVANGEYWFGTDALSLQLIDKIGTSDDYLFHASQTADIYEIKYNAPLSMVQKLTRSVSKAMSHARVLGV
jgi:serine protease SohB